MEQLWNYYGFVGIAIMLLMLVVMICEYADRDEVAVKLNYPSMSDDEGLGFLVPAWFEYKHKKVQLLARSCVVLSIILILFVSTGAYYADVHENLRAPFAYTYVLFWTVVYTYLWMLAIRLIGFLLKLLFYIFLGMIEWIFGTDFLTH